MMLRCGVSPVIVILLAWITTTPVLAQQRPAETIPKELAAALVPEAGFGAVPEFVVGSVPPVLADRIPSLPGARVLGSMVTSTSATIAMEVPIRADSVRTLVMKELPNRGWQASTQPAGGGGGFRPASARSPTGYCADGRMLTFSLGTRTYGTTIVKFVVRDPDNFTCVASGSPNRERVAFVSMSSGGGWPTLSNPRDVLPATATCRTQGSGFGQLFTTAVRVAMTPEQLMEHYAKQLTDSGFVVQNPDSGVGEISRTFTKRVGPISAGPAAGNIVAATQTVILRMKTSTTEPECRTMRMEASSVFDR